MGIGITFALFQTTGTKPSRMEAVKIANIGWHKIGQKSLRNQVGRPSGSGALLRLIYKSFLSTVAVPI